MGLFSGKRDYVKDYSDEELEEIERKVQAKEYDRKDALAMFIAAITTFLPPLLIFIGILAGLTWLIFR
ncbi:MAG: hypothetical protein ACOX3H_08560 [Saccharofermentanales bacterium]|jgi:hypothetical protein